MDREDDRDLTSGVLSVHLGRSANCSSVGSVVDVLFMSSVAGTAILGALAVYLKTREADAETGSDSDSESASDSESVSDSGSDDA